MAPCHEDGGASRTLFKTSWFRGVELLPSSSRTPGLPLEFLCCEEYCLFCLFLLLGLLIISAFLKIRAVLWVFLSMLNVTENF